MSIETQEAFLEASKMFTKARKLLDEARVVCMGAREIYEKALLAHSMESDHHGDS